MNIVRFKADEPEKAAIEEKVDEADVQNGKLKKDPRQKRRPKEIMPANHFDDLINEKNEAAFKEEYCKPQP